MSQYCRSCGLEHEVAVPRGTIPFDCEYCARHKKPEDSEIIKKLTTERDEAFQQIREREDGGDFEQLKNLKKKIDQLETELTEARSEVVKWARQAEKAESDKRSALQQARRALQEIGMLKIELSRK